MQLVVYFKDCPVRTPSMPIMGLSGGIYHFSWDKERSAHCRHYNLDDPADIERLRTEQKRLYNQAMPHPLFFDVEGAVVTEQRISEAVGTMALDLQHYQAACEAKDKTIAELRLRLPRRPKSKKKPKPQAKHIEQLRVVA